MKKKFLSLMMAAAVVATTSVSAFAAENDVKMPDTANITTSDQSEGSAQVEINGNIQDEHGNDAPSTFKVTVPTAANFTVNKTGNLVGPTLTVKNQGKQQIKVYAKGFTAGKGNIEVISAKKIKADADKEGTSETPQLKRSSVSLKLTGNAPDSAYLGAAKGIKGGVYGEEDLTNMPAEGVLLATLDGGTESSPTTQNIVMEGTAGVKPVENAVSYTFTLTLKIEKVKHQ